MIQIVFGLPRSGKTTLLSALAYKANHNKKLQFWRVGFGSGIKYEKVYTTFACSDCYQLDFDKLGKINLHDCLILIDEISLLCDSRNYRNFSDNLKMFFALHAHFHVDIVCCSQSFMDCDAKIRRMSTDYFLVEKSRLFQNLSYIRKIEQIIDVQNNQIRECYNLSPLIASGFLSRKKYYSLFDSFETPVLPDFESEKWDNLSLNFPKK